MSVVLALTCPSLQTTDIIKIGHISASGVINRQVRYEPFSSVTFSDLKKKEKKGRHDNFYIFVFFLSFFFFFLSKTYSSWLQIFRPFHVVRIPLSSHLVVSGCCRIEGPHQQYCLQSYPLTREPTLPHALGFKRHTSDHTRAYAHIHSERQNFHP